MKVDSNYDPYALRQDGSKKLTADWDAGAYRITTGSLALTSLTSGRVPYVTTNSLITDSANLTFDGTNLTNLGYGTFSYLNITDETNGYQIDGNRILSAKTTGNIFLGNAGNFTMSGNGNVAIGYGALLAHTSGTSNLALGTYALYSNTTGNVNIAIGYNALYTNTIGQWNISIGDHSLFYNVSGIDNVAIGASCLLNATGDENTAIGVWAGNFLTSGEHNIFIGFNSGKNQTTNSNRLIIDNQDRGSAANEAIKSLLYGSFNATASSQYLYANVGTFRIGGSDTNDPILRFIGSTNMGDITYDESADEFDYADAAITTTGIITAEQLTSTDDITMAGYLLNTLSASDTVGLYMDGNTNPQTYSGSFDYVYKTCKTFNGSGSTVYPSLGVGFHRTFTFDYDYTGLNTGLNLKFLYAGGESFALSGDINVTGGSGNRTLTVGDIYNTSLISGALTNDSAASLTLKEYGAYFQSGISSDVNYTGAGTLTAHIYGGYFYAYTSLSITAGTVAANYYGGAFIAVGSAIGTSVAYGGYFSATSADTNWGIYNAAGDAYLGIDSAKTYWGTGSDLQIYHDGTDSYIYNDTGVLKIQDAGSGINIGTATTQLIGLYGVTPVNQPDTVADATTQDLTGTDTIDQSKLESDLAGIAAAINAIIDRMQELGTIA